MASRSKSEYNFTRTRSGSTYSFMYIIYMPAHFNNESFEAEEGSSQEHDPHS